MATRKWRGRDTRQSTVSHVGKEGGPFENMRWQPGEINQAAAETFCFFIRAIESVSYSPTTVPNAYYKTRSSLCPSSVAQQPSVQNIDGQRGEPKHELGTSSHRWGGFTFDILLERFLLPFLLRMISVVRPGHLVADH